MKIVKIDRKERKAMNKVFNTISIQSRIQISSSRQCWSSCVAIDDGKMPKVIV